jgi:hypothetical protein
LTKNADRLRPNHLIEPRSCLGFQIDPLWHNVIPEHRDFRPHFGNMTLAQIRDILHGSEPLVIRMVSGREYRVKHPDYAALGQDDATLLFTDDTGRIELIRLSQLESINLGEKPAA